MTKRAPSRLTLTRTLIDQLPIPEFGRATYHDSKNSFSLRVESSGTKSFFWFRKCAGKPVFKGIGVYPETTVEVARRTAEEWNGQRATWKRHGYDPAQNPFKKVKAEPAVEPERPTVPLFSALVEQYLAQQIIPNANNAHAEADVRWIVKKYFAEWLERPLDSIGIDDVLVIRNALQARKKNTMANRSVQFVKAIFNWSNSKRDKKINFWPIAENPAADVVTTHEKPRETFLQADEAVRFYDALDTEPDRDLKDFLTLALETGARKSNIFGMRWQDVSFERQNWRIPISKNGSAYDISLSSAALQVIANRREIVPDSSAYVFPAASSSGHIRNVHFRWDAFRKRAKLEHIRLHDLRRSHGSWLAIAGVSLPIIAERLGHKNLASTKIYARLNPQIVAEAWKKGNAALADAMTQARARAPKRLKVAGREE